MKTILILSALALTLSAGAQRSRVGLKFLPGFTDAHDPFEQQNFQNRIKPRYTPNIGVQYLFELHDSLLFIESGIYFTDRGSVQRDFGWINGTYIRGIYVHHYYYSFPVLFRVELNHLYASFGPTIDYYLKTREVWVPEHGLSTARKLKHPFDEVTLGVDLNIGWQFRVTERIGAFAEGSFHPSGFKRDTVNKRLYYHLTYELGVGLNYRL